MLFGGFLFNIHIYTIFLSYSGCPSMCLCRLKRERSSDGCVCVCVGVGVSVSSC
jgi:hypothetical protein